MSSWFSLRLAPHPGSLASATAALSAAGIAVEGIVGSPEVGDGEVHIGVADLKLEAAIAALKAAEIEAQLDAAVPGQAQDASAAEGIELGIIGAILRGPRG